jgi:pimeloyl-ACP methyl ester carboxylesterase
MPFFQRDEVTIHYEEQGSGFPILLLAASGMRSNLGHWTSERAAWNAVEQLAPLYRVITMDQRNAGQSRAPIRGTDGWQDYADDQLALLDHLGVDRFHVIGSCIGGSFILKLIQSAPERVASAVVMQTIGMRRDEGNRPTFQALFGGWEQELQPSRPEVSEADWRL